MQDSNIDDVINNFQNILSNFNNSNDDSDNNESNSCSNDSSNNINFDINSFLMMKRIIDAMNQNSSDSRSNLLYSLKPYLRKDKQDKIDKYAQLLKMETVFKVLYSNNGGENK